MRTIPLGEEADREPEGGLGDLVLPHGDERVLPIEAPLLGQTLRARPGYGRGPSSARCKCNPVRSRTQFKLSLLR